MTNDINIYSKLNTIQTELKSPKGKEAEFKQTKYQYRSCDDILAAVKPYLKAHGLILLLSDEMIELPNSQYSKIKVNDKLSETETGNRVYIKSTATLSDGTDKIEVSAHAREPLTQIGMGEGQLSGATSSYARKYALSGLFCIDDTEDLDNIPQFPDIDNIETLTELKNYKFMNRDACKNKKAFDAAISAKMEVLNATKE